MFVFPLLSSAPPEKATEKTTQKQQQFPIVFSNAKKMQSRFS
jgi:hypothetical protein